jgi:hypothetical protein
MLAPEHGEIAMKFYTIKKLEWSKNGEDFKCETPFHYFYISYQDANVVLQWRYLKQVDHLETFKFIDSAKARANELHTQEAGKWLNELEADEIWEYSGPGGSGNAGSREFAIAHLMGYPGAILGSYEITIYDWDHITSDESRAINEKNLIGLHRPVKE